MNTFKEAIKEIVRDAFRANNEKDDKMVKNEDKRKIIDEVGGMLKDKVDEEVWRTVIGKLEKIAYEPSEDSKTDNAKAKNADEEEKEEKFEEEKEIAENKCKTKNEQEDKKEDDKKDEDDEKAENKCSNSMDVVRKAVYGKKTEIETYIPHSKRIEMGNQY